MRWGWGGAELSPLHPLLSALLSQRSCYPASAPAPACGRCPPGSLGSKPGCIVPAPCVTKVLSFPTSCLSPSFVVWLDPIHSRVSTPGSSIPALRCFLHADRGTCLHSLTPSPALAPLQPQPRAFLDIWACSTQATSQPHTSGLFPQVFSHT